MKVRTMLSPALLVAAMLFGGCLTTGVTLALAEEGETNTGAARRVSPEGAVHKAAMRYLDACVVRDAAYIAANSIDDPEGSFTGIHSGGSMKWGLSDRVEYFATLKPVAWDELDPEGFVVGDFAWFTDDAFLILPSGERPAVRLSLLMRRDGDTWKAAHYHLSAPYSN